MRTRQKKKWLGMGALVCMTLTACGSDGEPGPAGEQGETGEMGARGEMGEMGARGEMGEMGARGEMGEAGEMGAPGEVGEHGEMGEVGSSALTRQSRLPEGDAACFAGGISVESGLDDDGDGLLGDDEVSERSALCTQLSPRADKNWNRIASFLPCSQIDTTCDTDVAASAEIAAVSTDGMTLVYTDSPADQVGFVDISDAKNPVADGVASLPGEPTSVVVAGDYALVGVTTGTDFVNVAGELHVIGMDSRTTDRVITLPGQPDSVAVSPDGKFAAVVIENERDEDLDDGALPQLPAGTLVVVAMDGAVADWTSAAVDLTGLSGVLEASDPEPEYVDINGDNVAVVTLQENNALVLVDLASRTVLNSFSAGTVDLTQIDATEEDALIVQNENLTAVPREPDGVTWLSTDYFATANEGDYEGGSRSFSVWDTEGNVVFDSGNELEHLTARFGHYPDGRSENKGAEPENVEFAVFGSERYLFVNSERASLVFVYDVADFTHPVFKQALPAAMGPEGAVAIPSRNLLLASSEEDARDDKIRSAVNIYAYGSGPASYPTLVSGDRLDGTPIPWAALSGLAADPRDAHLLYSVEDSFFLSNRILTVDTRSHPARIVDEKRVRDDNDVFASITTVALPDASVADDDATRVDVFDEADLALLINADKTVNVDLEGITVAEDGGFWLASEGSGTVGDVGRPVNSRNFLFKTDPSGVIEDVVTLPGAVNDTQLRFGFEGVAAYDGKVYVAFQRVWGSDTGVRIGIYDVGTQGWTFVFYPLDAPESLHGGWVGLSDLTSVGDGTFMVIERDNQGGPDAAIKRLYRIDLNGLVDGDSASKTLLRDLTWDLQRPGGLMVEKVEGCALTNSGDVWIVNDNDGVDDNSGETQLLNLGRLL